MFAVLFEVNPRTTMWDTYLDLAKTLRPDLEAIDGFVDNVRYRSLTRQGWILSLSGWRDEKSLVRWRTRARHHEAQAAGRTEILADYHLRIGQITTDTGLPEGLTIVEQRLDVTEVGRATTIVIANGRGEADITHSRQPSDTAARLGLDAGLNQPGLVDWDVYEAVLTPGDVLLMTSWRTNDDADTFRQLPAPTNVRVRSVRVVRDYGMYDRRENPQYYPDVERRD